MTLLPALVALALPTAPVRAQPAAAPGEWTVTLTPYVWFAGLGGEVRTTEGSESFTADFGDIFGALKFATMGLFEARRGNVSLVVDTLYLNLQQGVPVPGLGAYSDARARTQSAQLSAIGLYTVAQGEGGRFELGGGVRAWWLDTELTLDAGRRPGRRVDNSVSWVDPVLSARGVVRLNDRLSLTGYGDIGGFGAGSRLTYQLIATLDWQVTASLSASLGYRWIHIDYDKGRSDISLDMAGPIIGASLRF